MFKGMGETIREKKEQTLQECISNIHTNNIQNRSYMIYSNGKVINDIKIMDKAYFEKRYIALQPIDQQYIETTIEEFRLNREQERIFRIVANHAVLFTTN